MIYYADEEIVIRNMEPQDAQIITNEEIAQGWNATIDKYQMRLKHQEEGRAISLVAEYKGNIAGYNNVYINAPGGPFGNQGYPEIVDFGVLEKYRCKGIGSKLMDVAEKNCVRICRYGVSWRGFIFQLWKCTTYVCKTWLYTGWQRRMVWG